MVIVRAVVEPIDVAPGGISLSPLELPVEVERAGPRRAPGDRAEKPGRVLDAAPR